MNGVSLHDDQPEQGRSDEATPRHYHYSWPHGRACEKPECPAWLPYVMPDGRCDDPLCGGCNP